MKFFEYTAAIFSGILVATPASAITFTIARSDGDSTAVMSEPAPLEFTLDMTGADTGPSEAYLFVTRIAQVDQVVSFHARYETLDSGGPVYDPFGYIIDGNFNQLSSEWADDVQVFNRSFAVSAGAEWGFFIVAVGTGWGPGTALVTGSVDRAAEPVDTPAPAAALLLAGALGALGLGARRRA
ncbi:hypothetical protein ACQ5SO_00615 [Rhodovulum sp. DZ06]|uniref:hypothetical protein n=1 Tax=Rhodovulum sp. DZ06 TaxID=3425126 RepID=UPI003D3467CB